MKYFLQYLGLQVPVVPTGLNADGSPAFRTIEVGGRKAYEASLPAPLAGAPAPENGLAYKEAAHRAVLPATISLLNAIHRAAQTDGEG